MRWLDIGLKDVRVTLRDRGALGILLGMPMLLIVILGSALGNISSNVSKIPVAIVNEDKGDVGAKVTDGFFTDESLVKLFNASRVNSASDAVASVQRGDLAGALIVPADLTRRLDSGRPSTLTVYVDPGRQVSATVFSSVAQALSTRVSAASIAARTSVFYTQNVPAGPGFVYGVVGQAVSSASATDALSHVGMRESTSAQGVQVPTLSYYAAAMSVMFLLFGSMFGAFSLVRERDTWTLPRMLTTPATKTDIVGGKTLGVFFVGLAQFGVLFIFTNLIGVRWGNVAAIWLLAITTVLAASGLAVLIASLGRTVRAVSGFAQIFIQFMAAVGGSFIPVAQFPAWLQPLHYFSVNGWAIDGMLAAMRGGGLLSVLPSVAALMVMASAFFALGTWRLRWE